jgi:LPXTG-motif cell wall-anchored protein
MRLGGICKLIGTATLVAGALLVSGGVADAYPPGEPEVTVDDPTPDPGGPVVVTVDGCEPGETVTFTLGDSTDTAVCGDDGTATGELVAPNTPGTFQGNALLASGASLPFQVVVQSQAVPQPTTPVTLPSTGSESNQMIPLAVGLSLAGAGLLGVASLRRRRLTA